MIFFSRSFDAFPSSYHPSCRHRCCRSLFFFILSTHLVVFLSVCCVLFFTMLWLDQGVILGCALIHPAGYCHITTTTPYAVSCIAWKASVPVPDTIKAKGRLSSQHQLHVQARVKSDELRFLSLGWQHLVKQLSDLAAFLVMLQA